MPIPTRTVACCEFRFDCRIFGHTECRLSSPELSKLNQRILLGQFLRDVMRDNMNNFRVFGPDETASNRLQAIYETTKKTWLGGI